MTVPFQDLCLVVVAVATDKHGHLLIDALHLPARDDDPRTHQPPMRVVFKTIPYGNAESCPVEFGDRLIRRSADRIIIEHPHVTTQGEEFENARRAKGTTRMIGRPLTLEIAEEPVVQGQNV